MSFYGHILFFFSSSGMLSHREGVQVTEILNSVEEFSEMIFRRRESSLLHITVHIWCQFFILVILSGEWYPTVILVCISLIANDGKHLFTVLAEEPQFPAVFVSYSQELFWFQEAICIRSRKRPWSQPWVPILILPLTISDDLCSGGHPSFPISKSL